MQTKSNEKNVQVQETREQLIERLLEKSTLDFRCCGKDFFVSSARTRA